MIGAILGAAQGIGDMISQTLQNKKNRQFQQDMYQQQKTDNIRFWEMENQYNSPLAQMQRLKDAGLNPNLVYGNGATATGGSIQSPKQTSSDQPAVKAPDMLGMMSQIYNMNKADAQTDLVRQQIEASKQTAALQAATTMLTEAKTAREKIAVGRDTATYDADIEAAKAKVDLAWSQIMNTNQNTRTSAASEKSLQAATENTIQRTLFEAKSQPITLNQLAADLAQTFVETQKLQAEKGLINANTKLTNKKLVEQAWINYFVSKGIRPGENIISYASKLTGDMLGDAFKYIIDFLKK